MIIGIDTSNLLSGGSITYFTGLIHAVCPENFNIERVIVWGRRSLLKLLPKKKWLHSIHEPILDGRLPMRLLWQWTRLPKLALQSCDVLFVPGGNAPFVRMPMVVTFHNMLPFEKAERRRYGISWAFIRLLLLQRNLTRLFTNIHGVIFLTEYARAAIVQQMQAIRGLTTTIPHGVSECFRLPPRPQRPLSTYSLQEPFHFLYVSSIDVYKHQWHVAEAIAQLRQMRLPVVLDLVGAAASRPAVQLLRQSLVRLDPAGTYLRYHGPVPFAQLHTLYHQANAFVFASSCENMPNILLEAMASGLPIACAQRGPMPEMLCDAGVYFDPENAQDIADALYRLLADSTLRAQCALAAYERAQYYSWERCASETFAFLATVVQRATEKRGELMCE